jgi:hypothetical protein
MGIALEAVLPTNRLKNCTDSHDSSTDLFLFGDFELPQHTSSFNMRATAEFHAKVAH